MTSHQPGSSERRAQLLDAAVTLIATRGYDAVRLRDVGETCGVTTGMIQYYFTSRDALLAAAFESAVEREIASWRKIADEHSAPWPRICALIGLVENELQSIEACVFWNEFRVCTARYPQLRSLMNQMQREWRALIADALYFGINSGDFSPRIDVEDLIDSLVAMIDGVEVAIGSMADSVSPRQGAELILRVATHLINPQSQ